MKKVLSLLLVTSSIFSMQLDLVNLDKKTSKLSHYIASKVSNKTHIKQSSVFVPSKLGSVELYHGKKGFCVHQDNKKHVIKKYFTDPIVRDITKKELKAFLEGGYLSLNQMEDGEFSLKAKGRMNGGGPLLGSAAYWITKSLCYAVGFAAISTTVVATGGTAVGLVTGGAAAGAGVIVGAAAVTTTEAAIIGTTTGVILGTAGAGAGIAATATVIGGAVGATTMAGNAALVTAAAVTTTGSVAATIAGVESVSLAVGTFFGMLPTP